jgi:hypothetical protein
VQILSHLKETLMLNPFKRKPKPYVAERDRLLEWLSAHDPKHDDYATVMHRLNDLDKILNRTSEFKKTIIPAAGTTFAIGGIYALQQFGGVLVPKALEAHAARQESKKPRELD